MTATPTINHHIRTCSKAPVVVPITTHLERTIDAAPAAVFDAYAHVDRRAQWYAPADAQLIFDSSDFAVGGVDHFVVGGTEHPTLEGRARYEHIIDDECIMFTEWIANPTGDLFSISLVTWTLAQSNYGTQLAVTDQTTSVVGSGPIEGDRYAYEKMLDRLTLHLAESHP